MTMFGFTGVGALIVGAVLIGVTSRTPGLALPQESFVPAPGPVEEWTNEIPISEDGVVVLHNSFFSSGIYRSGAASTVSATGMERVITFASHVTVGESWEPGLVHSLIAVDAHGTGPVSFSVSYRRDQESTRATISLAVTPLVGKTWGEVRDIQDLFFQVSR